MEVPLRLSLIRFFLAYGHGHFTGFPHAKTGVAVIVANHDERGKAEIFAALDYFSDAVDGDDVVFQIRKIDFQEPPNR